MSDQMNLPITDEFDDDVTEKTNSIFDGDEDMARYMANNEEHDYLGDDDE